MANDVVNVTEGSGKAIATETVTTLNAQTVTARDVQRMGLVNISGDGIADDITPLGEGTAITGQSLETGGAKALGWLSSIRKAITDRFGTLGQKAMTGSAPVVIASDQSAVPISGTVAVSGNVEIVNDVGNPLPVSGTFWQATQPVSGTFWQATQPVSAASLPLPTGAATAAKQPALGTAGTPSTDVLSIQGISGGTAVPITAQGTPTDRSSTLTTGGTAQQLAASNSTRKYLLVQNQSSGYLYIRFTGTAVQDQTSIRLDPGGTYENPPHYCPTSAVSIIGATTGQAFHSVEA